MPYLLALLPATGLTIAGYFVLYLSARSQGSLRTFGKYLGYWAFTLAALVILGAIFAAAHGGHHGHCMYCPWHDDRDARSEAPRGSSAPAPPGAPGAESETATPPTRQ
jgi:heme/copper-type cytochrome/quinol oxidase subunit 1